MVENKSISELALVLMGQSPPSPSCSETGNGLPFIQGNAEFGERNPLPRLRCSSPTRIAERGDLLLSVRAPVGELNHADQKMVIGRGLSAIRFPEDDQAFAWHALKWSVAKLNRVAQGSTFVAISRKDVENLEIPWCEEPNRTGIATVLDTVDNAIASTESVIAKLKNVRAGMLHDLLTRGLDKNGQLRPLPADAPMLYKDSTLGKIPKEWGVKTILTLCIHIGSGVTPRGGQDVYTSQGIMFIRSQNVTFEGLFLDDVAYIPESIHLGMLRSEVFAHDVLFNITGASIGRCCPMPDNLCISNVNQHVCALRIPEANASDAKYLASILASPIGQHQLDALNTMGNRQGLNYQQLGSFIIFWPNIKERDMIALKITEIENHIQAEKNYYQKLRLFKSGLTADLLTGKVRVLENIKRGKLHV
jgi:type I restriction enzyme S subunit